MTRSCALRARISSSTLAVIALLGGGFNYATAAKEKYDESAAKAIRATTTAKTSGKHGELIVSEFAKSGMSGSGVDLTTDPYERVSVSTTNRRNNA